MNTILLQKILDILREGLAHVGDFFKDLFVSDPQAGQVIGYDGETGKWKNMDIAELSFDITHNAGPAASITITDAAADMPVKALIVNVEPQLPGIESISITHNYGDNETEIKTINLPAPVYGAEIDLISGKGNAPYGVVDLGTLTWNRTTSYDNPVLYTNLPLKAIKEMTMVCDDPFTFAGNSNGAQAFAKTAEDNSIGNCKDNSQIFVRADAYTTAAAFKTAMNGVPLVYELATPTTVNTTPTRIMTQGGSETFEIDSNEFELEYYTATAGTIKDLVSITEDITSQVTKNTTDFSDILLKVSQNNKVVSIEIYNATTSEAVNETFLSDLPKPAMNCKVLLANTTLGEDGTILGTLKTSGELEIATSGAKTFSGLITYVAK